MIYMKKTLRGEPREVRYRIILTPAEEGGFTVTVPALPCCVSEGDSRREAIRNIKEAIRGHIRVARAHGDPVPPADSIEETVRVAI